MFWLWLGTKEHLDWSDVAFWKRDWRKINLGWKNNAICSVNLVMWRLIFNNNTNNDGNRDNYGQIKEEDISDVEGPFDSLWTMSLIFLSLLYPLTCTTFTSHFNLFQSNRFHFHLSPPPIPVLISIPHFTLQVAPERAIRIPTVIDSSETPRRDSSTSVMFRLLLLPPFLFLLMLFVFLAYMSASP